MGFVDTRLRHYLAILLVAMALWLPARSSPPLVRDSFWIDIVWTDQFAEQLRAGVLYPRWLPKSHDGLGAPVFYFYPPLAFYLTAVLSLVGFSTYASVIVAFGIALAGSGLAMFHWLKGWSHRPLIAALVYMAAPYHLLDFYKRGALAEFCAFAILPLIALGMKRAACTRRFNLLAASYATLILTHLPAALIVSVLLILPYGVILARKDRDSILPLILGILFGIGLAAIYLVPMLMLQRYVSLEIMITHPDFQVANWDLLKQWSTAAGFSRILFVLHLCGVLSFAAIVLLAVRPSWWACAALGYCLIVLGLIPGFWSLPLLAKVQFPWRALMLAEFALLTAYAQARLNIVIATLTIAPMLVLSSMMLNTGGSANPAGPSKIDELTTRHPDVNEYLPKGMPPATDVYSQSALDLAREHRTTQVVGDNVIAPHFYFPSWEVRCDGRLVRTTFDPATRLLSWKLTDADCSASIGATRYEFLGLGLSLMSVAGLLGVGWRKRRKHTKRAEGHLLNVGNS